MRKFFMTAKFIYFFRIQEVINLYRKN